MGEHTVHWLDILMDNVPAMTKLKSHSDLIAYLDDLTFCEILAMFRSVSERKYYYASNLRSASKHVDLLVEIFALVVVHKKRQRTGLPIELNSIV